MSGRQTRKRSTFFCDKTISDIKIKFGNQEIFAHKFVLIEKSIWFETALLGDFKESEQDVIDLGDEDDPNALMAMLRFCYDNRPYSVTLGQNTGSAGLHRQHITMYRLADFYDVPDLREAACGRLIDTFGPYCSGDHAMMSSEVVQTIREVLGPDVPPFADKKIQRCAYSYILKNIKLFFENPSFRRHLADGSMFNKSFSREFTNKMAQIVAGTKM